jgi:predicted metal-dependent hydrolase
MDLLFKLPCNPGNGISVRRTITLHDQQVIYWHETSARRPGVTLVVNREKGLIVRTRPDLGPRRLEAALRERAGWILTKLAQLTAQGFPLAPREYEDGMALSFQGQQLTLRLLASAGGGTRIRWQGEQLIIHIPRELPEPERRQTLLALLKAWYMGQARRFLPARAAYFCSLLNLQAAEVKVSQARSQWGSCNARGIIRLSWRLMLMPGYLSDYVIAHEVCHLRQLDHSPAFWQLLLSLLPRARNLRQELNRQEPYYSLY